MKMNIWEQIANIKSVLIDRGVDPAMINRMHRQFERDGADEEQVLAAFVGALYDGLVYGNWPKEEKP